MPTAAPEIPATPVAPETPLACPTCHQSVKPEYYFCPNCGTNLHPAPLSTTMETQLKLYAWSIVLPMILFIGIPKWPAMRYYKSQNPQEKQIGQVMLFLIILSTVAIIWYAYVWTQQEIQTTTNQINADMSI